MDLYEHQGKDLFAKAGIPLVEGFVAESREEVRHAAERLGGRVAVKAQVQIGGRGKAGGIALVESAKDAEAAARRILSEGFRGTPVTRVLVERLVDIAEQFYAAITLDRGAQRYLAMVSSEGGMDIEEVSRVKPEAIRRSEIDPLLGLRTYQTRYLVGHLPVPAREGTMAILYKMYDVIGSADATLVEINPLAPLSRGVVVALGRKVACRGTPRPFGAGEHLRRHHARRAGGAGDLGSAVASGCAGADRGSTRWDECRRGASHPGGGGAPADRPRTNDAGCGSEGCGAGPGAD